MKSFDEFYESLWANIHKKRQRIKQGSGEKMRKKGEKGAPTPAQMARAKGESVTSEQPDPVKAIRDKHKQQDIQTANTRDRELDRARLQKARMKNRQTQVEAPSLAVLKKKIKSGTKLGSTETASAKARGLIPRADGTKRKSPKYK